MEERFPVKRVREEPDEQSTLDIGVPTRDDNDWYKTKGDTKWAICGIEVSFDAVNFNIKDKYKGTKEIRVDSHNFRLNSYGTKKNMKAKDL